MRNNSEPHQPTAKLSTPRHNSLRRRWGKHEGCSDDKPQQDCRWLDNRVRPRRRRAVEGGCGDLSSRGLDWRHTAWVGGVCHWNGGVQDGVPDAQA
eukprot:scaffold121442_cov37-Tisochrysis_lutea.AAC.3